MCMQLRFSRAHLPHILSLSWTAYRWMKMCHVALAHVTLTERVKLLLPFPVLPAAMTSVRLPA